MKEKPKVECLIDDLEAPLFECGSGILLKDMVLS